MLKISVIFKCNANNIRKKRYSYESASKKL